MHFRVILLDLETWPNISFHDLETVCQILLHIYINLNHISQCCVCYVLVSVLYFVYEIKCSFVVMVTNHYCIANSMLNSLLK